MKEQKVHFNTNANPRATDPACAAGQSDGKYTRDPQGVTCGLCKRTRAWRSARQR